MRRILGVVPLILLMVGALFAVPVMADDRPYDGEAAFEFTDTFYDDNGIDASKLIDRLDGTGTRSVVDTSPDADFKDVMILETTGGFRHNGELFLYTVNAKLKADAFKDQATKDLANSFHAFIFPKAAGNPLVPGAPNRRQDNLFDDRGGYFSNNPLGLWLLRFVSWDGPNVNGQTCQDAMDDLEAANGTDLDGTPIITTVGDIEDLDEDGCIKIQERNQDGSQGFPWVV